MDRSAPGSREAGPLATSRITEKPVRPPSAADQARKDDSGRGATCSDKSHVGFQRRSKALLMRLRRKVRSSEIILIGLAIVIGIGAGLLALAQSKLAYVIQRSIYALPRDGRLSAQAHVMNPLCLIALPVAGLIVVAIDRLMRRQLSPPVDVVEANALHGGVIPMRDSVYISAQTVVSNGSGASVGLEAAYAQMGGGVASVIGQWLRLRRNDLRVLVGAGSGAAVGAAFGAPLTGAFYAFEIVIGAYTPAAIAPVLSASLAAALVVHAAGSPGYILHVPIAHAVHASGYVQYAILGILCAFLGIALMRSITFLERKVRRIGIPTAFRPFLGGLLLMPMAWITPETLSAGHGALYLNLVTHLDGRMLVYVFLLKAAASAVSLTFGFRGGLFFASLFLGSLAGQIFALLTAMIPGLAAVGINDAALVGMAALAVSIVGGPFTMPMLVLEATHNFAVTGAALAASLCASTVVRETFGFSFSTWRLHIRGETIRSARDVGWIKSLTAKTMMRSRPSEISATATISEFLTRFPFDDARDVVLVDPEGRYVGQVSPLDMRAQRESPSVTLQNFCKQSIPTLDRHDDIREIIRKFDVAQREELIVVDKIGHPIGSLSERYVQKRYLLEMEKQTKELFRENFIG